MKRDKYIDNLDCDAALEIFLSKISYRRKTERLPSWEVLDRVTRSLVTAEFSSPNYNAAAMDGIAVLSETTLGAREGHPLTLEEKKNFDYVNTGNPLPEKYDAVIMIEDVVEVSEGRVEIIIPARPWQHVRPVGEDIVKGEPVLFPNHKIRPQDIGALLSAGVMEVAVYKKPKLGIIPTGSEIVEDIRDLSYGKIMDSNSRVLSAMTEKWGGEPSRLSPVEDNYEKLLSVIEDSVRKNDIVIINAGSSTGTRDYAARLIKELGEVVCHGVALKPGKPTILGIIDSKPVIGIPGYPVSAFITAETFVKPLVESYLRQREQKRQTADAVLSRAVPSSLKHREIVRVTLGYIDGVLTATPLARGAGVTMSLVKADAFLEIPQNYEGLQKGEGVRVSLLKPLEEISKFLISVGSHDIVMDLISGEINLSSTHVGSMGGVSSLKRNLTHLAPVHVLDEKSGRYNEVLLKKYFADEDVVLIKGVQREQGLIIPRENPLKISGVSDLIRKDITFINRQRGAGTRILFDYLIKKKGLNSNDIKGYEREAATHMACATAVKSGSVDTALGIKAAADALELDFIPLAFEEYDFLARKETLKDGRMKKFLEFISSFDFQKKVEGLGGYMVTESGKIILKKDII